MQARVPPSVEAFLAERAAVLPGVADRLLEVVKAWDLHVTGLLEGGWNSLVTLAEVDEGVAVLKLTAEPLAVAREATALAWWGDEVAPRVLRHDDLLGALLMDRLEPGAAIGWTGVDDTALVLPLLRRIHRRLTGAPLPLPLPLLSDLAGEELQSMREHAEQKRHLVAPHRAGMAIELLRVLFAPSDESEHVVLHGDAVPPNFLRAVGGLRVIDPRPCAGERAYDAGYWSIFSGYGLDAPPTSRSSLTTSISMRRGCSRGRGRWPSTGCCKSSIRLTPGTPRSAVS